MTLEFTTSYIQDSLELFRHYKSLADRAIAQVTDEQLFVNLDREANSIAIIMKHLTGNIRSRWTDFLTTDGEKPDRDRDGEFVDPAATREALLDQWEDAFAQLLRSLAALTQDDLERTVTIRGEPHSVMQAISRQIAHFSYHTGQIVLLAKHLAHDQWQTLTVPRGQSAEFTRKVAAGELSQR